ncbi:GDSL-type esterase/lipase family protein [Akkermansia sp. N21116]|uniref:autotransporter-associated beta strand repeat-containing protein n=1 Tax=Akkermansia sp. N21116 TaxID=3040764 RepID=UPI00244E66BE|nr:autotransporter-associated beta strand repeat-containing protein [Akkermansia sp. N21116]WPX40286.1 GDSL-type esterase/lipase family protein [Akkermansia sp. N21116]
MKLRLPLLLASMLLNAMVFNAYSATTSSSPGNIVFVGDSITQGGHWGGVDYAPGSPSYRYSLFKNFVDNGVAYTPMGIGEVTSTGTGANVVSAPYRGQNFDPTHEAAASARTYTWSGIPENNRGYNNNPGTRPHEAPVWNLLGLNNPHTGSPTTFYNGGNLQTYAGPTYASKYGDKKPDTVCLMIGINDLIAVRNGTAISRPDGSTSAYTNADVIGNIHSIVQAYQEYNPNVNVLVMGLLPTASNNGTYGLSDGFNAELAEALKTWSTETSNVSYGNVGSGVSTSPSVHYDNAGAHPNKQGELIVAGNLARALGIGQRTLGLESKAATTFSHRMTPTLDHLGDFTISSPDQWQAYSDSSSGLSGLLINAGYKSTASLTATGWEVAASTGFTVEASMQLYSVSGNGMVMSLGDGETGNGFLTITNTGIYWGSNNTLLYSSSQGNENLDLRITYMADGNTQGVDAGYYVWRNGQLIGEALAGGTTLTDAFSVGSIDGLLSYGFLSHLSWETGSYAPTQDGSLYGTATLPSLPSLTGDAIIKANNVISLNSAESWEGGSVPEAINTIRFSGTFSQEAAITQEASLAVYRLELDNSNEANALVRIVTNASGAANSSNALKIGEGGIVLSQFSNGAIIQSLMVTASQTWDIAASKVLRIGVSTNYNRGYFGSEGANTITLTGGGLAIIDTASGAIPSVNWIITGNSSLYALWNTVPGSFTGGIGSGSVTLDGGTLGVNYGTEGGGQASSGNWTWGNQLLIGSNGGIILQNHNGDKRTLTLTGSIANADGAGTEATLTFRNKSGGTNQAYILTGDNTAFTGTILVESEVNLKITGNGTLHTGILQNDGTLNLLRTNSWDISAVLSGGGTLNIGEDTDASKTQTVTFSGNNTYTSATNILGGTLKLNHANALGSTSAVNIGAKGTLDLNGQEISKTLAFTAGGILTNSSDTIAQISVAGPSINTKFWSNGTISIDAGKTLQINMTSDHGALDANLTGSGTFEKVQNGVRHLQLVSTGNTFDGTIKVSQGYFAFHPGTANAQTFAEGYRPDLIIGADGKVTMDNSFKSEANALKLGNVTGSGIFAGDYGTGPFWVDVQIDKEGGAIFAGQFQKTSDTRNYNAIKRGTEDWILTGNSTATGVLKIEEGKVQLGDGGTTGSWAGSITGAGQLIINRTGEVTISTDNSFSGGMVIKAGTVTAGHANAFGADANIITLAGGNVNFAGNYKKSQSLVIAGGSGTATVASGNFDGNLTIGKGAALSLISGANAATYSLGTGITLMADTGATLTGNMVLDGGTIVLNSTDALANTTTTLTLGGSLSLASEGSTVTLNLSDFASFGQGNYTLLTSNTSLTQNILNAFSVSGLASDSYELLFGGTNDKSLILSILKASGISSLTWNGGASGTWSAASGNTGWTGAGVNSFKDGDKVSFLDIPDITASEITLEGTVKPSQIIVNNTATSFTWKGTGIIADSEESATTTLLKEGSGELTIANGANTFSGGTTISGGSIKLQAVQGLGTGTITLSGANATLLLDADGDLLKSGNKLIFNGGTLSYGDTANQDISTLISDSSTANVAINLGAAQVSWGTAINKNLTINGTTGILTLNSASAIGANSLTIQGGTVQITSADTLTSATSITLSGTGTLDLNGQTISNALTFSNGGILTNTAAATARIDVTGDIWQNGTVSIAQGSTIQLNLTGATTLKGKLEGSGTFAKSGSSNFVIDTIGSKFDGTIQSNAGYIIFSPTTANGQTFADDYRPDLIIDAGANVTLGSTSFATEDNAFKIGNLTGSGDFKADYGSAGDRYIDVQIDKAGGATYSGKVMLASNNRINNVIKRGTEDWILTGDSTTTGVLKIAEGAVQLGDGGTTGSWAGSITGTGQLILNRTGDVTISTDNSFSGGMVVKAGTVISGHANAFGADANTITLAGGSVNFAGNYKQGQSLVITGGITGTASIASGTFNGNITMDKDAVLTLASESNTATYSLATNISLTANTGASLTANVELLGGTIRLGADDFTAGSSTALTINGTLNTGTGGSATLDLSAFNGLDKATYTLLTTDTSLTQDWIDGTFTVTGLDSSTLYTLTMGGTDGKSLLFMLGTAPGLEWHGGATGTWSTASDNTGWGKNGDKAYADPSAVTFLDLSGIASSTLTIEGTVAPGAITVSNSAGSNGTSYTWQGTGIIADAPNTQTTLVKNGSGELVISNGANTFSGGSTINGGTVTLRTTQGLGTGAVNLASASGILKLDASGDLLVSGNKLVFNGGTLAYGNEASQDISDLIDASSTAAVKVDLGGNHVSWANALQKSLVVNGTGSLTLGQSGSVNGNAEALTINGGTVVLASGNALKIATSVQTQISMAGGTLDLNGNSAGYYKSTALLLGKTLQAGGTGENMLITNSGEGNTNSLGFFFTTNGSTALSYDGSQGAGKLVIDADISHFGTSNEHSYTFHVTSSTKNIADAEVELAGQISRMDDPNNDGTKFTLKKTGDGRLMISGANYLPGLNIAEGTLIANHTQALGVDRAHSNQLAIGDSGTLDLWESNTVSILSGTGRITNSSDSATVLTIGRTNAASSFSGIISGNVGLTIDQGSTFTLTGSPDSGNTHTGPTTVQNGSTLILGNAEALGSQSALAVNGASSQAALKFDGTVSNAISGDGILNLGTEDTTVRLRLENLDDFTGTVNLAHTDSSLTIAGQAASLAGLSLHGGSMTVDGASLSIASTTSGIGTGALTVTNNGSLDMGGNSMDGTVTMHSGSLRQIGEGTTVSVIADGDVALNGILGERISRLETVAGATVSGINGTVSLDSVSLTLSMDNLFQQGTSMEGKKYAVLFQDGTTDQLSISGHLQLGIASMKDFLMDQRENNYTYDFLVTNGNLDVDTARIDFNPLLKAIGYTLEGIRQGVITIGAVDPNMPYIIAEEEQVTFTSGRELDSFPFIEVDGTLNIELSSDTSMTLKDLRGETTSAMIQTGDDSSVTLLMDKSIMDDTYAGSISGGASIGKTGKYTQTIGGNVATSAGFTTITEGDMIINGSLTTARLHLAGGNLSVGQGLKATSVIVDYNNGDPGKATLAVTGDAAISGGIHLQKGSMSVSGNIGAGSLSMDQGTELNFGGDFISLSDGESILAEGSVLNGNGIIFVDKGATFTNNGVLFQGDILVSMSGTGSASIAADTTFQELSGSGNLTLNGNSPTATLAGDRQATFSGQLLGAGTLLKTGRGVQFLNTSGNRNFNIDIQNGVMVVNAPETGSNAIEYAHINVGQPDGNPALRTADATTTELHILADTYAESLTVNRGAALVLGSNSAAIVSDPVSLTLKGNAVFAEGSSISTIVPNSEGGVVSMGTITLPKTLSVTLVNYKSDGWEAPLPDLLVMHADQGFLNANGTIIGKETTMSDWNVTLEKSIALFYTTATLHLDTSGKKLVATPTGSRQDNLLQQYAQSETAAAGADMLWNAGLQTSGSNLDRILAFTMDAIQAGQTGIASRAMAASAGNTLTSLMGAQKADYRYQQTLIRNRMTIMGLPEGYDFGNELPLWNTWIQANGTYNNLDGSGDAAGFRFNTWGGTFGIDANVSEKLTLGMAITASYGKLTADAADHLSGDMDTYYANLFARYQSGKWGHNFIVTAGRSDAKVSRTVCFGNDSYIASSTTNGLTWGAMYEATYDIALNDNHSAIFQPLLNVSVMKNKLDSFAESGADNAGLHVSDLEGTTATFSLGGRLMGLVGSNFFGRESLGEVRLQIAQDCGDTRNEGTVGFLASPAYGRTVKGSKAGTTAIQCGTSLSIPTGDQGSIFMEANADIRTRMTTINGSIGYRYNF